MLEAEFGEDDFASVESQELRRRQHPLTGEKVPIASSLLPVKIGRNLKFIGKK